MSAWPSRSRATSSQPHGRPGADGAAQRVGGDTLERGAVDEAAQLGALVVREEEAAGAVREHGVVEAAPHGALPALVEHVDCRGGENQGSFSAALGDGLAVDPFDEHAAFLYDVPGAILPGRLLAGLNEGGGNVNGELSSVVVVSFSIWISISRGAYLPPAGSPWRDHDGSCRDRLCCSDRQERGTEVGQVRARRREDLSGDWCTTGALDGDPG